MAKVFAMALHRSGSKSMAEALEVLGIPSLFACSMSELYENLDRYDGFTHDPVTIAFKELDARYPGSKFLFLWREKKDWLETCRRFPNLEPDHTPSPQATEIRTRLYRSIPFDEEIYSQVYDDVLADVREYFRERPDDLLFLNVTEGEGWEKLCPFLGKGIPRRPFPKKNTAKQTYLSPWFQVKMQFRVFGSRIKQSILRTLRPLRSSA